MKKTSPLAITSLICGIAGFFFCITAPVAIVTGHMARGQIKKDPNLEGEGIALAGLIMGYLITILLPLISVVVIAVLLTLGQKVNKTFDQTNAQLQTNTPPAQTDTATPDVNQATVAPNTNAAPSTNAP